MTVTITQFKWAGKFGPFKIKTECKECELTTAILKNMMSKEFKGKDVKFEIKPWLDNFFYCIVRLAWHAPIIMVDGRKFHQFSHKNPLFDRKKLEELVLKKIK
jgi:predicted methyltransferase